MAQSRETQSKKEVEKKKAQKKKEKEQRKEERKASKGGGNFEDMIAYVDENGNLSSTPPDPTKKRVIKEEEVQIGVPRQAAASPMDYIRKGVMSYYNDAKGYGFIKDSQSHDSVFVHMRNFADPIKLNDTVTFEVENGPKGPSAVNVKLAR
jgi:cold shock CspA family protein